MTWQPPAIASNNMSYDWYRQDATNGCGCASILVLIEMMQGKRLDEATIHRWMDQAENHQRSQDGVRSFEDTGGRIYDYNAVLNKVKITCSSVKGDANIRKWVTTATMKKPLLAHIFWHDGGGHTVVVAGHTGTHTIFLDPALGVVEIPDAALNTYTAAYGGAVPQTGTIELLTQPL